MSARMRSLSFDPSFLQEVFSHPLTFGRAAEQRGDSRRNARCRLLDELGCHRKGLWRRECGCGSPDAALWGVWAPELPKPHGSAAQHVDVLLEHALLLSAVQWSSSLLVRRLPQQPEPRQPLQPNGEATARITHMHDYTP